MQKNIILTHSSFIAAGIFLCFLNLFCCHSSYGQFADTLIVDRLNSLRLSLPIPYHDKVKDCLRKITQENKQETQKALEDFLPHKAFFQEELVKAGLPQEFCYLPLMLQSIQRENKGAFYTAGVWNLPLWVAVKQGLIVNNEIDERCNIKKSTAAAIAYLLTLKAKQKNTWDIIIAYSNSLSALEAAKIRTQNSNDIWTLYEAGLLQNKNCIPYFIAYTYLAHFYPAEQLEVNCTNTADSTYGCNEFIPQSNDTPEIKKPTPVVNTPPSPPSNAGKKTVYVVKKGDTLSAIARKYQVTIANIKRWNKLKSDMIGINQKLVILK